MFGVVLYARSSIVKPGSAAMMTVDGTQIVQTASFAQSSTISSALPDEAFTQLKQLTVSAPAGGWVQLNVVGAARIVGTGQFGSVIKILTHAGTITIDGRVMTFSETASPIFEEAGFVVAPNRRRLLDVGTSLVGFFNYCACQLGYFASFLTVDAPIRCISAQWQHSTSTRWNQRLA